ncbi:MAG: MBL fold metallo-hydrolase [Christensenellaceae bacterium]|nr:MBL fold metallo-hydrolase [Christensenellaceae bacterium]
MQLYIAGGCGEHGRNCFYIQGDTKNVMIDCGVIVEEGGNIGYPELSDEQIENCELVLITHSHGDHVDALPWLFERGYKGDVVASKFTFEQIPFDVNNAVNLEDICPDGKGEYKGIDITWGRSGHCVGGVWYKLEFDEKVMFFSGDYCFDTQVYACDEIIGKKADIAVIDCAYGKKKIDYQESCFNLIKRMRELFKKHKIIFMPVPKHGRSIELMELVTKNGLTAYFYGDEHIMHEIESIKNYGAWLKFIPNTDKFLPHTNEGEQGIVFISDSQLNKPMQQAIAKDLIDKGAYGLMTGTVDKGSFSENLINQGKMEYFCYPIHLSNIQYNSLKNKNVFACTVAYHTEDFKPPNTIKF